MASTTCASWRLLADVRRLVAEAKEKAGRPVLYQPGLEPAEAPKPEAAEPKAEPEAKADLWRP